MTAQTLTKPHRRGACPGLSAPMPTGDGLLVRLLPRGTIPLAAFAALCGAARENGNGVIEITSRGGIQIRGLSEASAPQFADTIAMLDIAAADGVPVLCNPLCGLDAEEIFDATSFAEDLRHRIAQCGLAARLSPKVSVIIDGGGAIGLDAIAADIRLRAHGPPGDATFEVSVGGDAARAFKQGRIKPAHGAETILRLLDVIAGRGRDARARDIVAAEGAMGFGSAIEALLRAPPCAGETPEPDSRLRGNERAGTSAIGTFSLRDGTVALGVGPAFGHADANVLRQLIEIAETYGATGLRTAPERALLVIGLAPDLAQAFSAQTERLGFITQTDDPRRKIIACAGAPICASAQIASRALAPAIAADAARFTGTIHISGCAKGCAHAARAALTVIGTSAGCALIANGSVHDMPFAVVPENELRAAIKDHVQIQSRGRPCLSA
jgi:precorrin-3B synthase